MKKILVPAIALMLLAAGARADEGMWTFDNFPSAAVKAKYGVTVDQAWLDHVQGAAVRLSSGCSASLVSSAGLVLTNHHCVRDCAQSLSSAKADYATDGFSAARREEEKLCPGMQAEILTTISDVTARITGAAAGKTGQDFVKARDGEIAAVEKDSCKGKEDRFHCQVITFYQGGQYQLYTYRRYSDVRLVFAVEGQTAFFGGDPDNFNFPRYDLDCSFVRLYENGKPVKTSGHLAWSTATPKDGEPVFIAGNPGSTQRLLTAEQLETLRDVNLPKIMLLFSELRGRLIRFASESAEHARIANDLLFGVENSYKAYHGELKALVDPALILAARKTDARLKANLEDDAALLANTGDPWNEIANAQAHIRALYYRYGFMESRAGIGSDLFRYARQLVRAAAENAKPNSERLPDFTDSRLQSLSKTILDPKPVYPEVEQLALEFWLSKLRENLTADADGTRIFLGKDSPETLSARLAQSKLGDPEVRKALWDGGMAAIQASDDPMIKFVLATDAASRAIRKEYEERVTGPVDRAAQKIAQARFAVYGTNVYPDATFSLRLTYGKVGGWQNGDVAVPAFTYYKGLWARATGQFPFNLMPRWQEAEAKVNGATVYDFVSDNDIIGGNSGSPVINAKGEVVGAIFDGNIDSLGGAFGFDRRVNRAVSVSTAAITEALKNIYGNQALLAELKAR